MLDRTEDALAELLGALRARVTIQRRVLDDLGHGGSRYTGRMKMPHMVPGSRFDTVLENALALMGKGYSKGEAMAIALNVAGYRPPPVTPTSMHRAPGQRRPLRPVTH